MIAAYGRELHQQYTLGYYPAIRGAGNQERQVRVQVGRPKMMVPRAVGLPAAIVKAR